MIKALKLDWLSNTRNAILYSLSFSLMPYIKKYCNKNIDSINALQAMLIYLADEEVKNKLSSFFVFVFILIIFLANSS